VDLTRAPTETEYEPLRIESETDYVSWTHQADHWLVHAYGDHQQKGAVGGCAPCLINSTLGAP